MKYLAEDTGMLTSKLSISIVCRVRTISCDIEVVTTQIENEWFMYRIIEKSGIFQNRINI